ncbi:MAG: DUF1559 domain-containing protein [Opitutaceae bacterium]|jgi:prepilin-type processing-associated H-X9-DG protein/prepilin-type N-terminal cleavage/methylation domain-containing protein|nr:DUF1559 domain-containing protein [Opitutaceae bacterium]
MLRGSPRRGFACEAREDLSQREIRQRQFSPPGAGAGVASDAPTIGVRNISYQRPGKASSLASNPPAEHAAFTLVELLTVIAIIGILAAITIPVVGKVREAARKAECASNLRQIGAAMYSFANDNRQMLPPTFVNGDTNLKTNNWWVYVIPYLGYPPAETLDNDYVKRCSVRGPLHCPKTDPDTINEKGQLWVSYVMNQRYRTIRGGGSLIYTGARLSDINTPAQSLMVAEGRKGPEFTTHTTDPDGKNGGLIYPHGDKGNALFADGHVETLTGQTAQERWQTIYTDSIADGQKKI